MRNIKYSTKQVDDGTMAPWQDPRREPIDHRLRLGASQGTCGSIRFTAG